MLQAEVNEFRRRVRHQTEGELFVDPRDRRADPLAQADLEYKGMLRQHSRDNYGTGNDLGYFDHEHTNFNQFATINGWVRTHTGNEYTEDLVKSLLQHQQLIDRCFWPDSVEQIMENLRRETHPIAKDFLSRMESNSMTSMKIALKMLRQARNMCFGQVLKMELNVALNKVMDEDFELGVKQVLMKPKAAKIDTINGQRQPANPGFSTDVSAERVDSYFEENEFTKRIDLDVVEGSLLPTRHFFEQFADSVRVYINGTSTP